MSVLLFASTAASALSACVREKPASIMPCTSGERSGARLAPPGSTAPLPSGRDEEVGAGVVGAGVAAVVGALVVTARTPGAAVMADKSGARATTSRTGASVTALGGSVLSAAPHWCGR